MLTDACQIRRITDPADPAIQGFGRLQDATYADPDLLIPPSLFPTMVRNQGTDRCNFLVVAEAEGEVIGGMLFHYLPAPNTGFGSFIAVTPAARGRGVARSLHTTSFEMMEAEAGRTVHAMFIDVVAPERMSAAEAEQEAQIGSDPLARRHIFHRLGFRKVEVPYFQPPDEPGGEPITSMDLLCCPRTPADAIPSDWVVGTMLAYWTPWFGRPRAEEYAAELRRLCGRDVVDLSAAAPAGLPSPGGTPQAADERWSSCP